MDHVETLTTTTTAPPHDSRCHGRRRPRRHSRLLLRQQQQLVWVLLLASWHSVSWEVTTVLLLQPVHAGRTIDVGRNKRSVSTPATNNTIASPNDGTIASLSTRLQRHWRRWMIEWWQAGYTKPISDKDASLLAAELATGEQDSKKKREKEQKKRQKRTAAARNGRQKMQRCRHLATSREQTPSRWYRLWKRGRNVIRQQRQRWRRRFSRRRNSGTFEDDTTEREIDLPLRSISYSRDMNLAYSMAAMASLSYWPFHKKPLPDNRLSFELMTLKDGGHPAPLHTHKQRGRRRKRDHAMSMALKGMAAALKQTSPWLPRSHRNRQNKGSYREWWQSTIQDRLLKSEQQHQQQQDHRIQLEYALYNWYEPTTLGLNYHDTDLLVATSNNGETLILAFAGSDSVPDTVTNLQTFESVQHMGGLFHSVAANRPSSSKMASMNTTTTDGKLEGSIHRGFLNAYSRTERGSVLKLCDETNNCTSNLPRQSILQRRYGHCGIDAGSKDETQSIPEGKDFDLYDVVKAERQTTWNNSTGAPAAETKQKEEEIVKKRGRRGCKVKHTKLIDILRELVTGYLSSGKSVLLSGHSLGGSLATILALDMVMNFPQVPVDQLQLWTFGGAQIADSRFLESALSLVPRLQSFLEQDSRQKWMQVVNPTFHPRSQFHRFVSKWGLALWMIGALFYF